jgi:hypothetical protein
MSHLAWIRKALSSYATDEAKKKLALAEVGLAGLHEKEMLLQYAASYIDLEKVDLSNPLFSANEEKDHPFTRIPIDFAARYASFNAYRLSTFIPRSLCILEWMAQAGGLFLFDIEAFHNSRKIERLEDEAQDVFCYLSLISNDNQGFITSYKRMSQLSKFLSRSPRFVYLAFLGEDTIFLFQVENVEGYEHPYVRINFALCGKSGLTHTLSINGLYDVDAKVIGREKFHKKNIFLKSKNHPAFFKSYCNYSGLSTYSFTKRSGAWSVAKRNYERWLLASLRDSSLRDSSLVSREMPYSQERPTRRDLLWGLFSDYMQPILI